MKQLLKTLLLGLLLTAVWSCNKEEELNPVPSIEFVSISTTNVESFNNQIVVNIAYKDEDGDLGQQDPDEYSLRIKDARLNDFDWYHIPPLTPNNEALNIEGEFSIELNALFLLGNGSQESTTLSFQLIDRAGNWSNTIQSPQILIVDSL
jgi:hypothetical protein